VLSWVCLVLACGPKEIPYRVQIVTQSCDPLLDPFEGVTTLKVLVTGEGIDPPLESTAPASQSAKRITVPNIPAGKNRVIEVRAFTGDGAAKANIRSLGRSLPFEVPSVYPVNGDPAANVISIFLRRTNRLTPVSSAKDPKVCQTMRVARAGHAAALLKNGKVFIAGGYDLKPESTDRIALASTELFNPATGLFETGKELSVDPTGIGKLARAFQTATSLPNGQVLLWGGESYQGTGATATASPTTTVVLFDPSNNQYRLARQSPGSAARSRHAAGVDKDGKVLIIGGSARPGLDGIDDAEAVNQVEWFNPETAATDILVDADVPRMGAAVVPSVDGKQLFVVGGAINATTLANEIVTFEFEGNRLQQKSSPAAPSLTAPGRRAGGAAFVGPTQMAILGGYGTAGASIPLATTEVFDATARSVKAGPSIGNRAEMCVVTLPSGTVWAFGGRTSVNNVLALKPDESSILLDLDNGQVSVSGGPDISVARYEHTCTLMLDGTVLVTGGRGSIGFNGAPGVLQDAFVFQPGP
jgi:Galactose oxidase, central domain